MDELRKLRADFNWSTTTPLSEAAATNEVVDGKAYALPAIHYVQIYVRNAEQLRELDELGVHYDLAPLFDAEWPTSGDELTLPFEGDPQDTGGQFVFALMPAVTYNQIRQVALEGEETYDAIMLRTVPADARAADGSVSWSYLKANLEAFAPAYTELSDEGEVVPPAVDDPATKSQKRAGRRLRKWVRRVRDVVRAVVDGTRVVIGAAARAVLKDTRLTINTYVPNRSDVFESRAKRAWDFGGSYGSDLTLKGLRVDVVGRSGLALYRATANANGVAQVSVPRGIKVRVCFEADSPAARFEAGLLRPVRHCKSSITPRGGSDTLNFAVQGYEFYAMAQFIDSREYAERALGHRPPKATVQVGTLSDWLSVEGRAFVPCMAATSAPVSLVNAYTDTLNAAGGLVGLPLGDIVEFAFTTDIVFPREGGNSRMVATHEYGHFVLCTLLHSASPQTFNLTWSQVVKLSNLNQEPGSEVVALNEGFADWFTSQVVGGVNYFALSDGVGALDSRQNQYFSPGAPASGRGMEENVGGPACTAATPPGCPVTRLSDDPNGQNIATVATILHDIIDRARCPNATCRNALRSDAAVWSKPEIGPLALQPDPQLDDIADERIDMTPRQLADGIRRFASANVQAGRMLSYDNLYQGLTSEMLARNYSAADICALFALHRPDGKCPAAWTGIVQAEPVRTVSFSANTGGRIMGTATGTGAACTATACTAPNGGGVTLTATADSGFNFVSWSGCSTQTAAQLVLSNLTADQTCTANFAPRSWSVTANATAGGRVAPTSTTVSNGGSVTLEATPNDGFRFSGYGGDPLCTGNEPRLTLNGITRDVQCIANFSELQRFRVGVARMGESNAGDLLTGVIQPSGATCAAPECSVIAGQSLVLTSATRDLPLLNHGWTCTNQATGAVQQSTEGDLQTMTITLQSIDADWNCESDIETLAN